MLIGRTKKDTAEITRLLVDLSDWLDEGEVIGSLTRFSLLVSPTPPLATAWQVDYPFLETTVDAPINDTAPLILTGAAVLVGGKAAALLVGAGTPGLTYIVSCIATGATSGRQRQLDFLVTVAEMVNTEMISSLNPAPSVTFTVVSGGGALALGTTGTVFVQNAAAAPITITLPPSPSSGQTVVGVDDAGNANTYAITWTGDSGAQINGAATYLFSVDNQSATFQWDGTQWVVL